MQSGTLQSETTEDFDCGSPTAASNSSPEVPTPMAVFATIEKTAMGVVTSARRLRLGWENHSRSPLLRSMQSGTLQLETTEPGLAKLSESMQSESMESETIEPRLARLSGSMQSETLQAETTEPGLARLSGWMQSGTLQ